MLPPELLLPILSCAGVTLVCWLLSLVTREYSWVDRIWSVVPPIYVGEFAYQAGWADARLNLMTLITALWGLRLTLNFVRKGGYAPGGEDYRWAIVRQKMSPVAWQLFNLFFTSIYQNVLLLLIALPAWPAYLLKTPLGASDYALSGLFLLLLGAETLADQQQWDFQQAKKARKERGESGPEFVTTGLWKYSRHPNFFCEFSQWWVLYLIPVAAGASALNVSLLGPVLLTLLFLGSTVFTEQISRGRYPSYADYQARTSMLVPWFPRK